MFENDQNPFRTTADNRFNSFENPWNSVNVNQSGGQWGIDQNYLTPNYMSPYRPRYQGNGIPNQGYNPGFWSSANYLVNPFRSGGDNYAGSVYQQTTPFINSALNKPMDYAVNATQQVAIPMAMTYYMYKYGEKYARNLGKRAGLGVGFGLGKGMGFTAANSAATASHLGGIGGFAGGMFLPFMGAEMATHAVDELLFDPYINQRRATRSIRSNFSGISFGGTSGNSITGRGFSRGDAADLGRQINVAGAKDLTFSQREYGELTDYIGRSGMLDGVDANKIGSEMQSIVKQMKAVMAIAKTPGFKEATELTAKLVRAGSSLTDISTNIAAIGGYASASGISVDRFINTTGMQGQFLAQSNGLTPLAGMMVAGQANSAFASAFRSGLLSPTVMARMGGVEGATQSGTAGIIGMMQSPYATMMGMNALHGGVKNSVVGNLSAFGGDIAKNPISSIGMMNLLKPSLTSNLLKNDGLLTIQKMIVDFAKTNPSVLMNGKGGVDSSQAYMILTNVFGQSDDQARATLSMFSEASNAKSYGIHQKAFQNEIKNQRLDWARQHNRDLGIFTGPWAVVTKAGRDIKSWVSNNRVLEDLGLMGDSLEKSFYSARFGEFNGDMTPDMVNQYYSNTSVPSLVRKIDSKKINAANRMSMGQLADIDKINAAMYSPDPKIKALAEKFMNSSGIDKINTLYSLAKQGVVSTTNLDPDNARDLIGMVNAGYKKVNNKNTVSKLEKEFTSKIKSVGIKVKRNLNFNDRVNMLGYIGILSKVGTGEGQLAEDDPKVLEAIAGLGSRLRSGNTEDFLDNVKRQSILDDLTKQVDSLGLSGMEKYLADPEVRKQYDKGTAYMTDEEKGKYLLKKASEAGVNVLTAPVTTKSMYGLTSSDINSLQNNIDVVHKASASLSKMRDNSLISDTEWTTAQSALDIKEASIIFSGAVNEFREATGSKGVIADIGVKGQQMYNKGMKSLGLRD